MKGELAEPGVLPEVAERVLESTADEGRRLAGLEQQLIAVRVELTQAARPRCRTRSAAAAADHLPRPLAAARLDAEEGVEVVGMPVIGR